MNENSERDDHGFAYVKLSCHIHALLVLLCFFLWVCGFVFFFFDLKFLFFF